MARLCEAWRNKEVCRIIGGIRHNDCNRHRSEAEAENHTAQNMPEFRALRITTALVLSVASTLLSACILIKQPISGIADNGDFSRIMGRVGLEFANKEGAAYISQEYGLQNKGSSLLKEIKDLMPPLRIPGAAEKTNKPDAYYSTQLFPLKLAIAMCRIYSNATSLLKGKFDIRFLSVIYILLLAASIFMISYANPLLSASTRINPALTVIPAFSAAAVFCDSAYISYFNSLYSEPSEMVFLLLLIGIIFILSAAAKHKRPGLQPPYCASAIIALYSLYYAFSLLFIGSKEADAPAAILFTLLGIRIAALLNGRMIKITAIAGSAALLLYSSSIISSIPPAIRMVNQYDAVFYGILKDSPSPEKDIAELGFDRNLSVLKDSNYFVKNLPIGQRSVMMQESFYSKPVYARVVSFYMNHPYRLMAKLAVTARSSALTKPPYLGNFNSNTGYERGRMDARLSVWSSIKKLPLFSSPSYIAVFLFLSLAIIAYERIKLAAGRHAVNNDISRLILADTYAVLWLIMLYQFTMPVIASGEGDLSKHLFLFNMCHDIFFVSGIAWLSSKVSGIKLIRPAVPASLTAISVLIILAACIRIPSSRHETPAVNKGPFPARPVSIGDVSAGRYARFGGFAGKPVDWMIADKGHTDGVLLISCKILCYMPFDTGMPATVRVSSTPGAGNAPQASGGLNAFGSNRWAASGIRMWLNSAYYDDNGRDMPGFLAGFTDAERSLIKPVKHRCILSNDDSRLSQGGSRPHFWSSPPSLAVQNYYEAWYEETTDKVFLPDVMEACKYRLPHSSASAPVPRGFWLRTPYAGNASYVRYVGEDGQIYNMDACCTRLGVIPALYLPPGAAIRRGSGSRSDPYVI